MTSWEYGEIQWSDSDPVVNPTVITVAAGDEIVIMVNGYDAAAPWAAPAATLTVNLAYDAPAAPEVPIQFASANMTLEADLTLTFWVKPEVMAQYEDIYVEYLINGKLQTVTEVDAYNNSNKRSGYHCTGIAPYMIKQNIQATIYGTYEGVVYSYTMDYSAGTYLYNQLAKNVSNAKIMRAIVDLLNYGTIHQLYVNLYTDNLINAEMTDAQKAFGTAGDPALESIQDTQYEVIENPTASFKGAGLDLENAVIVRLKIEIADLNGAAVRFRVGNAEYIVDAADFAHISGNQYYVYLTELNATQFRTPIFATILRDGQAISNTLRYSVETYAYNKQTDTKIAYLADLVKIIINYGDAAKAIA